MVQGQDGPNRLSARRSSSSCYRCRRHRRPAPVGTRYTRRTAVTRSSSRTFPLCRPPDTRTELCGQCSRGSRHILSGKLPLTEAPSEKSSTWPARPLGQARGSLEMDDFPRFVKNPANRIATSSEHTPGVEGYVFDGADGSQVALWRASSDAVTAPHTHDFDEYFVVIEGAYFWSSTARKYEWALARSTSSRAERRSRAESPPALARSTSSVGSGHAAEGHDRYPRRCSSTRVGRFSANPRRRRIESFFQHCRSPTPALRNPLIWSRERARARGGSP